MTKIHSILQSHNDSDRCFSTFIFTYPLSIQGRQSFQGYKVTNYTIQGLEEYIRQSEPDKRERGEVWRVAIGLQQVDGLTTSDYLVDTAKQHIDGEITIVEAKALIDSYYKSASTRHEMEKDRTEEADKVSARIAELLSVKATHVPLRYL